MERDMDLVKEILLTMEKKQPSDLRNEDLEIEGYLGRTRVHLHDAPDDQRRAIKIAPPPFFSFSMLDSGFYLYVKEPPVLRIFAFSTRKARIVISTA